MAYERDHDAHHKTVGAIAARDDAMARRTRRRAVMQAGRTKVRDRQLAGMTYGARGGLLGMGLDRSIAGTVARTTIVSVGQPPRSPDGGVNPPPLVLPGGGGAPTGTVSITGATGIAPPLIRPQSPSPFSVIVASPLLPMPGGVPVPTGVGVPAPNVSIPGSSTTPFVPTMPVPSPSSVGTPGQSGSGNGAAGADGSGGGTVLSPPTVTITPVSPVPDLPEPVAAAGGIPKWMLFAGAGLALYLLTRGD